MPRKPSMACMICDPDPCTCFVRTPKQRTPKTPTVEEPKAAESSQDTEPTEGGTTLSGTPRSSAIQAAMRGAARKKLAARQSQRFAPVNRQPLRGADDALLAAAIRNLGPLLHEEERTRYRMILSSVPSLLERRIVWRARHGKE